MEQFLGLLYSNKEIILTGGAAALAALGIIYAVITPKLDSGAESEWGKRIMSFLADFKRD